MQEETQRRSNAARTEATKAALIAAARTLFVEKGFAETGTPEIVRAAQVTRGALYHHFDDKTALFQAVVEDEARAVAAEIARKATPDLPPFDAMMAGADAYFDAMAQPGRTRLMLIDGPAVLDAGALRAIDAATGTAELREGLRHIATTHEIDMPVNAMATLLSAMFDRAALAIAEGEPRADYLAAMRLLIAALLRG